MFLKRLESVGFKSFANRINLEFMEGVTAVVGPNGSGKSNITDAIRWVLGEQSARSLRGSKMEDIIFQGSENRKPLNVAEVSLILDNSKQLLPLDYKEVNITRRVYRSGESEYLINKQPCRLKDIVDLFMDSGLGREAFSIISQGKVEEILSSKAEERRKIFEEAAGVLKYKQRKTKSEYKLAETEENLYRVEDIIHEITQQISPLEEQSKKAKTYLNLKEKLKENEVSLLITEIEDIHLDWEKLLEQLETAKMKEIEWKTATQREEATIEEEQQRISFINHDIEQLQERLLNVTEELERYQGKKQVYNEREKHVKVNIEKLQEQTKQLEYSMEQKKALYEQETSDLTLLRKNKEETVKKVNNLTYRLSTTKETIMDDIEDLKSTYIEKLNEQAVIKNEKQSMEQQVKQLKMKKRKHEEAHNQLLDTHQKCEKETKEVSEKLQSAEKMMQQKQNKLNTLKTNIEKEQSSYNQDQRKLYEGYQQIEKLRSRKEVLGEMKEDFQGFFQGVKAILKARDQKKLQDVYGALIELIDIPKELIPAIETVLGGQAQHIVVAREEAARKAISYLKQTNNGRATFLPISSIQPRKVPEHIINSVRTHTGYVGIAAEMVKVDAYYESIIQYSMGHVILAKTLKDANEIAHLSQRRYRIVTLEGDVVNPGGSMSGGAKQKRQSSIFTREKDLQEVTERLYKYETQAKTFSNRLNERKDDLNKKESKLAHLEKEISHLQIDVQTKKDHVTKQTMELKTMSDNISLYQREQKQFKEDEWHYKKRSTSLSNELDELKIDLIGIQDKIDILTKQESDYKDNEQKDQEALHAYQITLAEQEERIRNQQEKVKNLKSSLEEQYTQLDDYQSELNELLEIEAMKESEEVIQEKIKSNTEHKNNLLLSLQEKRSFIQKKTEELNDRENELKEIKKQHQQFLAVIQEKEVKSNRLDVELENRLTQLQTEYEITYERAKEQYEKSQNKEESKKTVQETKDTIKQLGTVNLGAIDEFERISERYNFLAEQKQDLEEAKATLYQAIAEMDTEMKRLFNETFSQIKEEFTVVFKELFGGGYAELTLTSPEDLLNTGVDIIAQPPGKKLQHLSLLSGGERALTAIALLFSILRVRPVPFCVLDEVEAALDETNVNRFAKYVRSHSNQTQFIVITHRKGTMEEADVLYGITMQEPGVSRLVSVRLEDTNELIEM